MKEFAVFLVLFDVTIGAKILGLTYVPCKSHQIVYNAIWNELAARGHEVTVLTPFPQNNSNIKEISPNDKYWFFSKQSNYQETLAEGVFVVKKYLKLFNYYEKLAEQQIITIEAEYGNSAMDFDLIMIEEFHPIIFGIGCKFKAPIIAMSSLDIFVTNYDAVGNPSHPLLTPVRITNYLNEILTERLLAGFVSVWLRIYYNWFVLPRGDQIVKKIYPTCSYLGSIESNVSLIFVTHNPILQFPRPVVPAVIDLRQIHLKQQKPLPMDLQLFLDNSAQGVIYFSLGSTVKTSLLTTSFKQLIITAVSQISYNILLKWESCSELQMSKNVLCKKWFPQQDVLSHKNIKVFVSQGGLQSLEESIANGIPLVGLPFLADQPHNVLKIVELGIGLGLDPRTITRENLVNAIVEVAKNFKYKERTLEVKKLLEDQPMKSLDTAIWWIEYVIRHKGARHLRSPLIDMPWYRYFMVDVISFVLVVLIMILFALYKLIKLPILLYRRHKKNKTKKE